MTRTLEWIIAEDPRVPLVEGAAGDENLDALLIHAVWRGGHTVADRPCRSAAVSAFFQPG